MSSVVCAPKICMYCRNASTSSAKPITHECAIVPADRNAEAAAGLEVRRRRRSRRCRRRAPRACAASSPCARRLPNSITRAAVGGGHHARGLAGHRGLKRDEAEQRRLDQLRLGGRRGHPHDRLVAEDDLAFLHRPHVAGEPERRQVRLEERRRHIGKRAQRPQPRDLVGREAQGRQILERLLEAGRDQVLPVVGQPAHEQLEGARPGPGRTRGSRPSS